MNEPHTHPVPITLSRENVSPQTLRLWEKIRNVIANEEAWYIIEAALLAARVEGYNARSEKVAEASRFTRDGVEGEGTKEEGVRIPTGEDLLCILS